MSFVNRVLYIPTDYAEFFPLAKCARTYVLAKKRTPEGREKERNKEREEEREADGAVCFAYRSAKIPRATRQEAAPITYVENRNGDATRERRSSPSLFLSHGTERSFRSGVNIYARAITAHLNETSVPIVYDEDGSGG